MFIEKYYFSFIKIDNVLTKIKATGVTVVQSSSDGSIKKKRKKVLGWLKNIFKKDCIYI